jgi:gamma-glutamyl phosphate reductase
MSVRIVDDLAQAIAHMEHYGSHHSDAIVTANPQTRSPLNDGLRDCSGAP